MNSLNKIKKIMSTRFQVYSICIFLQVCSCKKFVDISAPPTKTSTISAFTNDISATAVLTGIYAQIMNDFATPSVYGTSYYAELAADNLSLVDPNFGEISDYYLNSIPSSNYTYWEQTYKMIYAVNVAVTELSVSKGISEQVKKRLLGEAQFMRAFLYFYLVNIYGDVPLAIQTDQKINRRLNRSSVEVVYEQINKDLDDAEKLLDYRYVSNDVTISNTNRIRPNLGAVKALQARVFLFQKRNVDAEAAATSVINQSSLYNLTIPEAAFIKNSLETIWALQPVTSGQNTKEAAYFLLTTPGIDISRQVYLSENLMNSFESGDRRKVVWTQLYEHNGEKYPYVAKYKQGIEAGSNTITEYAIVLRLAEQYLIRAEARNEQGNIQGAIDDLNALRAKRRAISSINEPNPLPELSNSFSKIQISQLILHERQTELFAEWGHRWFDLKRTGNIDVVMTPVTAARGGVWSGHKALYPIPVGDIVLNGNLSQNDGYQN